MIKSEAINFSEFYIYEFFDQVRDKTSQEFSEENHQVIDELFTLLSEQTEITEAISKLAQEKASGELSIFLFDIFDRAQDYPPTELVDALPDIAEDFVSGLTLMLEEEGTIKSIKKVNNEFKGDSIESEIPESDTEKMEESVTQIDLGQKTDEENHLFTDYTELSFINDLRSILLVRSSENDTEMMVNFSLLLIENLNAQFPEEIPEAVEQSQIILKKLFPWRLGKPYSPATIMRDIQSGIESYASTVIEVDQSIIEKSVETGHLVFPEKLVSKDDFKKEEIPEKPTTIDSLLSEYFQTEVDEYLIKFKKTFKNLQDNPENENELNTLIGSFQSFKEICMIHGYVILEDFCSDMISLCNQAKKENKVFNTALESEIQNVLFLLQKTDKFKDAKSETAETLEVRSILEKFRSDLFVDTLGRVKKETEEIAQAAPEVKEIPAKKKTAVLAVYKDLLTDLDPLLKEEFMSESSGFDRSPSLLAKLKNGAVVLDQSEIVQFIDDFSEGFYKCKKIPAEERSQALEELHKIYETFTKKVSTRFKHGTLSKKIKKIVDTHTMDADQYTFKDTGELLKILMEIEKINGGKFSHILNKIFVEKDDNVKNKQLSHFRQLAENLSMLGCSQLKRFPEMFIAALDSKIESDSAEEIITILEDTYQSIIDSISKVGINSDIEKELNLLKETLNSDIKTSGFSDQLTEKDTNEPESVTAAVDELPKETEESTHTDEEDLDEIFKQESENYLVIINQALQRLKENPEDPASYENIEKSLHSLKSSARLMGHIDVADIAAPIEGMFEILHSSKQKISSDDLGIIEETIAGIKSGIDGESINPNEFIEKLKTVKINKPLADEEDHITEEQLFADTGDEDEDLLDIFKEESTEYIKIVEKANQTLYEDLNHRESLGLLEHAMHSLKSAAKMLGFSEIGQLADSVEVTAVAILKGEIRNNIAINEKIAHAIKLIKDLTAGEKLNIADMDAILSSLSIYTLKEEDKNQPEDVKSGKIEAIKVELDEQTELFIKEGWELLEKINRDLLKLEKNPKDENLIGNLNRTIHTLKGSAQILNFKHIGTLAHKIEDLFEKSKSEEEGLNESMVDVIFKAVDTIQELINSIKTGEAEKTTSVDAVLGRIDAILKNESPVIKPDIQQTEPIIKPKVIAVEKAPDTRKEGDQFIKITTDNLDNLVNMAAELVINKTQLGTYLEKLKKIGEIFEDDKKRLKNTNRTIASFLDKKKIEEERAVKTPETDKNIIDDLTSVSEDFNQVMDTFDSVSTSFRSITRDFEQNMDQISILTKTLHDDILQARMVPTEVLFNRFPRAVRDMAKKLKKKVNLVVEGEEAEMDRALVESLTDPVMHLVRNAIDHGIETPKERKEKDKSEDGIILLKAKRSKNQIIIEVQDDGQGINPAIVKDIILKKRWAEAKKVEKMKESEILDFVFHPGFSTMEKASDVSGRGVGLDVVADQLQKLNGDIRISSTVGKGTIFSIRVPLTLAIAQAMLVKVGSEILCIPLASVEETVQFKDPDVVEKDEKVFITVRDELIPVVYLSTLLNFESKEKSPDGKSITAIIVQESGTRYGLIVDEVLRREEILIKSLGDHLTDAPFISGGTIFGDGSVCLILDIPSITQKMESDVYGSEKDFAAIERARKAITEESKKEPEKATSEKKSEYKPEKVTIKKKKITGRSPNALIIDDSVSVRKFVSSVLEKNNYVTALAEDGPDALDELRKGKFDIIITDLEMPKMHGFDLIEEIRSYKKYQKIPIVILTGRAGKKNKDKGVELGANAYITKPFKENDLLKSLEDFIEIA